MACRETGAPHPVVLQPYYNLMNRMPEVEVFPAARAAGLGVAPYSPLARGVLSGKYQPGSNAPPDTRAGRADKRMMETEWRPESLQIAQKLKAHAEKKGITLPHLAVAWILNNDAITSVIAGPRTFEQWTGYFGALDYVWTAGGRKAGRQPRAARPSLDARLHRSRLPGARPLRPRRLRSGCPALDRPKAETTIR